MLVTTCKLFRTADDDCSDNGVDILGARISDDSNSIIDDEVYAVEKLASALEICKEYDNSLSKALLVTNVVELSIKSDLLKMSDIDNDALEDDAKSFETDDVVEKLIGDNVLLDGTIEVMSSVELDISTDEDVEESYVIEDGENAVYEEADDDAIELAGSDSVIEGSSDDNSATVLDAAIDEDEDETGSTQSPVSKSI